MKRWEERAKDEVTAAFHKETFALRDSLPEYLKKLSDALSTSIDRSELRRKFGSEESEHVGKKHGLDRAKNSSYTIDQMIYEYHILRQVIFDVMEEEAPLTDLEQEIIICSVEQAVNGAATQFSETLRDTQEHFTHILAHDLRNPIAAAKMSAQMIQKRPNDADHCFKAAGTIATSMGRLDSMIQDLLDAGQLQAGQSLPLKLEEFDLDTITRQIAMEFKNSTGDRFVVKSPGPTTGYWSKNGISRVIENLVKNAVKYATPDTSITISIQKNENTVTLTVHNEGNPIPTEEQAVLFQEYRRSKSNESKEGWGLGLTVVKGITEAHHGKVLVESTKGSGTNFSIELPLDSRIA